jgi:hypothetical protein
MSDYTPQQLATKRRNLALEYRDKMVELGEIKKRKVFEIIKLMADHKTINKCELYYSATDDGQKEIELEMYCKGLLETMRAVKSEADLLQAESYGQY